MAYSTLTLADSIRNLFNKNNTTTSSYNISNGMSTTVQNIFTAFHKSKPLADYQYPAIFVEPSGKSENHDTIGNTGKRNMEISFDIVSIVQYGLGQENGGELSDRQLILLTDNLEYLLRNHTRLSSTSYVLNHSAQATEYAIEEYNDTYNSISKISLQIQARSI